MNRAPRAAPRHALRLTTLALALAACGEASTSGLGAPFGEQRSALSLASTRWLQLTAPSPPARIGHGLGFDANRNACVTFGGRPPSDSGSSLSDTWLYDGAWQAGPSGLPSMGFIDAAFDSARSRMVTYGGLASSGHLNATWELGPSGWQERPGSVTRSTVGLAYDSARQVVVAFGGFDGSWQRDLREWDGSSWTERCTSATCLANRPGARANMGLTFDAARGVTVLFGGFGNDTYFSDTWIWDGTEWTQLFPSSSPSPRDGAAFEYDPVTRKAYLFGGNAAGTEMDDLWGWDGEEWTLIEADAQPFPRREPRWCWDPVRRRGLLFGGRNGSIDLDPWELSIVGNSCASDDECHTGFCDGALCADPPVDAPDAGPSAPPAEPSDAGQGGNAGAGGGDSTGTGGGSSTAAGGAGSDNPDGSSSAGTASVGGSDGSPTQQDPLAPGSSDPTFTSDLNTDDDLGGLDDDTLRNATSARSLYACGVSHTQRHRGPVGWLLAALGATLALRRRRSSQASEL